MRTLAAVFLLSSLLLAGCVTPTPSPSPTSPPIVSPTVTPKACQTVKDCGPQFGAPCICPDHCPHFECIQNRCVRNDMCPAGSPVILQIVKDSSSCKTGVGSHATLTRLNSTQVRLAIALETPNPCYNVAGRLSLADSTGLLELTSSPSGDVCVQCLGEYYGHADINLTKFPGLQSITVTYEHSVQGTITLISQPVP